MKALAPVSCLAIILVLFAGCGRPEGSRLMAAGSAYGLPLASTKPGQLPAGWVVAATNPQGELARWQVVADSQAAGKPPILAITELPDKSNRHYNLCWTKDLAFRDGTIEVKVRADSGVRDQGGGPIWRVTDARNYYIARYNPLESNFRLYRVQDGRRTQLATAEGITIRQGEWFTIRIVVAGESMEGYLDGRKLLDVSDKTFAAGGVGLWSKADAASSFRDFTVVPAEGRRPQ